MKKQRKAAFYLTHKRPEFYAGLWYFHIAENQENSEVCVVRASSVERVTAKAKMVLAALLATGKPIS